MSLAANLPESIREFVENGGKSALGQRLFFVCIEPAMRSAGIDKQASPVDQATGFGLGGEVVRYVYWHGLQRTYGEPPICFDDAKSIVTEFSAFSDEILEKEHVAFGVLGALSCAYEKGYQKIFGEPEGNEQR